MTAAGNRQGGLTRRLCPGPASSGSAKVLGPAGDRPVVALGLAMSLLANRRGGFAASGRSRRCASALAKMPGPKIEKVRKERLRALVRVSECVPARGLLCNRSSHRIGLWSLSGVTCGINKARFLEVALDAVNAIVERGRGRRKRAPRRRKQSPRFRFRRNASMLWPPNGRAPGGGG